MFKVGLELFISSGPEIIKIIKTSGKDIDAAGFRPEFSSDISLLVMKRARMAMEAGCTGVVCSGLEVKMIKENFGKSFVALTPGI